MAKKKVKERGDVEEFSNEKIVALIEEKVEKGGDKLSDEEKAAVIESLKNRFIEGKEPTEAMDIPEVFPQLLYKRAYDLYNLGVYEEANGILRVLCLLEPMSARYQLALAATNHQMGKYDEAVTIYTVAFLLDQTSPIPWFHIYDCFMCQNEPGAAHFALRIATDICGERPEYQKFKFKCYRIMNKLNEDYHIVEEKAPETPVSEKKEAAEGAEEEFDVFEELKSKALEEPE